MDNKTKGAWIIHHANKLQGVTTSGDFEQINFAGKCGLLLSSLSTSEQAGLGNSKVEALAKAANISVRLELPLVLQELSRQQLISIGTSGIEILGLTSAATLEHTATIFQDSNPLPRENAVVDLAEQTSDLPLDSQTACDYIGDTYKITKPETSEILTVSEYIGFIDAEQLDSETKLIFNGNLFRRGDAWKINAVCSTLSTGERSKIDELNEILRRSGCIGFAAVERIMGKELFKKVHSIGLYDVNTVGNEHGKFAFVTRPSAFSKFSGNIADDAFDLAKAFVTSLTYGMTLSASSRGRISMIHALMQKLVGGSWVGPATAIGQDYRILELKRVVELRPAHNNMFYMRLLKKEVGQLAMAVILEGDASAEVISALPGASVTQFIGPEPTRAYQRKHQNAPLKKSVADLLQQLRTGAVK